MRLIAAILLFVSLSGFGQEIKLSEQANIHIITCGPGQYELYSAFGHSAIRVSDPVNGIDFIYNYGVFDFNQPNFYLNFARGYLNYQLLRQDYRQFRNYYIYYDRSFTEQVLDLDPVQKQNFFNYLEWNNKPENRHYLYDYFYDNCATRIVDVTAAALGDEVEFDGSHITEGKTIRQLTDDYLQYQPWGDLGIDICLGIPMDILASPEVHRFLPDYVMYAFDHAKVKRNGEMVPLVKETLQVYKSQNTVFPVTFFTPSRVFWTFSVLILILTTLEVRRRKWFRWFDLVWFGILGVLGLFLLLLWLATDHRAAAWNLNLLWALPTHFLTLWYLVKKPGQFTQYVKIMTVWYLLIILNWSFLPQQMHPAFLAFAVLSLFRFIAMWIRERRLAHAQV